MAPVHCAAGSDGEMNFGVTSLAAPKAASSRVVRYSFTRVAVLRSRSLSHSLPGIDRCLLASATIRLASTAKPWPPTRPAAMHLSTTCSNTRRKISLSRKRSLRARENAEWSGDLVLDAQAAEPAVGKVHLDLATQLPLRADRKHVTDNEHPDHEHRIERGPADRGIVRRQLRVHPRQIQNRIDLAHAMIGRNNVIEMELIEQLAVIALLPPHHGKPPRST
jgi:hypothetical protein